MSKIKSTKLLVTWSHWSLKKTKLLMLYILFCIWPITELYIYQPVTLRDNLFRDCTWHDVRWKRRSRQNGLALVNIRLKALLSSVGFRKRMTSRSPRGFPCDSCKLRFDRPLWFVWWSDVCFEVLSCFFDHPSIDSTKKMPLHLFGKDVLMFRLDQAS